MTDYLKAAEQRQLVQQEISRVTGVNMKSDMAMIPCPFHADKSPSCGVYFRPGDDRPGNWYCFGCNRSGLWDELADALGLEKFDKTPTDRFSHPINVTLEDTTVFNEKLVFRPLPKNKIWREISTNLLIDVGCQLCKVRYETNLSDTFIWMPVYIGGELEGYIKARKKKIAGKPSYINKKGPWAKTRGLFPFDYAISQMSEKKAVVLVEGQRDALRLLDQGIPAICIMGTHSWTDEKSKLLDLYGVKRAIICLDGDDAGISGTNLIYPSLKKFVEKTSVIKLWNWPNSPYLQFANKDDPSKAAKKAGVELWDPFNCPQEVIDTLKELV